MIRDDAMRLLLDLEQAGACTATGLNLDGVELSFDRYAALLGMLGEIKRRTSWMIGDALNYGERVYGETYAQAAEATGLRPSTLATYRWVCDRVPYERRLEGVSFSAHEAVATLNPGDQRRWLQRAADENWTRETLRSELRDAGLDRGSEPRPSLRTLAEQVAELAEPRDGGWWVPGDVFERLREAL